MNEIFTIGTSKRQPEDFIDILISFKIESLVDVRRFPTSKLTHFKKHNFARLCQQNDIHYQWLGDTLGGFREEGYEAFMKGETFKDGMSQLKVLAEQYRTAICCAEKEPNRCHRKYIASKMESEGWKVVHILDKSGIWKQKQLNLFD